MSGRSASRRPSRCGGSSSSLASVSGMSAGHLSSSVSMCNEQWNSTTGGTNNISSDSSCCTAPAAYFQFGSSSVPPSSSNGRKHMRSASSSHSLSAILNDYTNDKLSLDAQLDQIVPQEIYDKSLKRNSRKHKGTAQQFFSTLRADAIVSSIKKFSEASRQHLPEECHQKAVSACERSTSLCQDITNRISPSTANDNTSVSPRKSTGRQAGSLSPANPGLLLFVAAMCCVVLYGNLNSSPNPLSDSDARYERMLATRGSTLRSLSSSTSAHRSLQQMQAPNANSGGPTDINALLESQYRAQEEMHHSASVLAASNAAASASLPAASDAQQAQHLPSRHQPTHHSAHHLGQYAQQPQPNGPQVLISEPTYYPDTDYSGASIGKGRSWFGAGIWLSVLTSVVGALSSLI